MTCIQKFMKLIYGSIWAWQDTCFLKILQQRHFGLANTRVSHAYQCNKHNFFHEPQIFPRNSLSSEKNKQTVIRYNTVLYNVHAKGGTVRVRFYSYVTPILLNYSASPVLLQQNDAQILSYKHCLRLLLNFILFLGVYLGRDT